MKKITISSNAAYCQANILVRMFFIVCCPFYAHAQIITTFAGIGPTGPSGTYSGDSGQATSAGISRPNGIIMDGAGNTYFADGSNCVIRKVDTAGVITTFAGTGSVTYSGEGGPATAAGILVNCLAVDVIGNIYVTGNVGRVRVINTAGIINNFAGNGTAGYSGDGFPATTAVLNSPGAVAVDTANNVYISESTGNRIRRVNTSGIISTIAGTGTAGFGGDGFAATAAVLNQPGGIAVDKAGNIYIADVSNYRIRRIDATSGIITTFAGDGTNAFFGDGGSATTAKIGQVDAIAVDDSGNVYIGDFGNSRIRMVNISSGVIKTIVGNGTNAYSGDGGPATAAEFFGCRGITVSKGGVIYFSDNFNNRVRVVNYKPHFAAGPTQNFNVCVDSSKRLDSLLAVADTNAGQRETWNLVSGPSHGTAVVTCTYAAAAVTVTPPGVSYTPAVGYTGYDTLRVRVTDRIAADTTSIYIQVIDCHLDVPAVLISDVMNVYPNPNDGLFSFEFSSNTTEEVHVVVTNIVGQKIQEITTGTNAPQTIQLDVPAGVYFLNAATKEGGFNKKVVVTK